VCTLKQTVKHVNQSNKQGSYNINGKLAFGNRVNTMNTVPKNPKVCGSVVPLKVCGMRNTAKKKNTAL
jgi:hypothetical protein